MIVHHKFRSRGQHKSAVTHKFRSRGHGGSRNAVIGIISETFRARH